MSFRIVRQTLSDKKEPIETTVLPEKFDKESGAETAIKMKIAAADHAGYDAEHKAWWARNDDGLHIRYFTEAAEAA